MFLLWTNYLERSNFPQKAEGNVTDYIPAYYKRFEFYLFEHHLYF